MLRESAITADFVPLSPPLSLSLSIYIYSKSLTLSTLITQIGFPGDEGTRKEKGGTAGGP